MPITVISRSPPRWPGQGFKRSPRDIATALVSALQRESAVQRWVEALEIAGPGFVNLRLKAQRASAS